MEFKLENILKSTLLFEGRKEDVIKKYGEENIEVIERLSDNDPSGNNKYLGWMAKQLFNDDNLENGHGGPVNAEYIIKVVTDFHQQLQRIKNKDINSYKLVDDLRVVVDDALKKAEEKKAEKEADKVYEDNDVIILAPLTVRASCKYGAGSKWCIAGKDDEDSYNRHFDDYSEKSTFYFVIQKNVSKDQDPKGYKWALQVSDNNNTYTWWNAQDQSQSSTPRFVTDDMLEDIRKYQLYAKSKKLERQKISYLSQPTLNKYNTFKDILSDDEKNKVIKDLISEKVTSAHLTTLFDDLTRKQINYLINTVNNITNNDFNALKEKLTKEDKLLIIELNPQILNNYTLITELDELFSDEEKNKLSKKIDNKKINNTDSKVLLKKWNMSKEDLDAHKETSFYVFLSEGDEISSDGIENIVKVDPLNPESYRTINMMKLRKSVQPNLKMYGIKTKANLLDEFLGGESIPLDIIGILKDKSVGI